jgi:hypothetical protein
MTAIDDEPRILVELSSERRGLGRLVEDDTSLLDVVFRFQALGEENGLVNYARPLGKIERVGFEMEIGFPSCCVPEEARAILARSAPESANAFIRTGPEYRDVGKPVKFAFSRFHFYRVDDNTYNSAKAIYDNPELISTLPAEG